MSVGKLTRMVPKEFRAAVRLAHEAGWRIESRRNCLMLYPPSGSRAIPIHRSSRGGGRQKGNALVQLSREGLAV